MTGDRISLDPITTVPVVPDRHRHTLPATRLAERVQAPRTVAVGHSGSATRPSSAAARKAGR
jgi:hypothetical protein